MAKSPWKLLQKSFYFLETFKCPFTGEEMLRMTLEGFQPGFEKTIQSGFESRKNN